MTDLKAVGRFHSVLSDWIKTLSRFLCFKAHPSEKEYNYQSYTTMKKELTDKEIMAMREAAFKKRTPAEQASILKARQLGLDMLKALNDTPREDQY